MSHFTRHSKCWVRNFVEFIRIIEMWISFTMGPRYWHLWKFYDFALSNKIFSLRCHLWQNITISNGNVHVLIYLFY